jgi:hypothetical protein
VKGKLTWPDPSELAQSDTVIRRQNVVHPVGDRGTNLELITDGITGVGTFIGKDSGSYRVVVK